MRASSPRRCAACAGRPRRRPRPCGRRRRPVATRRGRRSTASCARSARSCARARPRTSLLVDDGGVAGVGAAVLPLGRSAYVDGQVHPFGPGDGPGDGRLGASARRQGRRRHRRGARNRRRDRPHAGPRRRDGRVRRRARRGRDLAAVANQIQARRCSSTSPPRSARQLITHVRAARRRRHRRPQRRDHPGQAPRQHEPRPLGRRAGGQPRRAVADQRRAARREHCRHGGASCASPPPAASRATAARRTTARRKAGVIGMVRAPAPVFAARRARSTRSRPASSRPT